MDYFQLSGFGRLILQWVVGAVSLSVTAMIIPGFRIRGFGAAMKAAAVLAIVNFLFGGILHFLAFPFTILTFGLFIFVIDAFLLKITAALVSGFEISGWIVAILAAFIYTFVHSLFEWLVFAPMFGTTHVGMTTELARLVHVLSWT